MTEILIRKQEMLRRTGFKEYTSVWRLIRQGQFPQPVVLNPHSRHPPLAWRESEVQAWIESRPHGMGRALPPEAYARAGQSKKKEQQAAPMERARRMFPLRGKFHAQDS